MGEPTLTLTLKTGTKRAREVYPSRDLGDVEVHESQHHGRLSDLVRSKNGESKGMRTVDCMDLLRL